MKGDRVEREVVGRAAAVTCIAVTQMARRRFVMYMIDGDCDSVVNSGRSC